MTRIVETDAIALRVDPFSETSSIVTWLTRDYGRITTLLKGAMRPKSPFSGRFDVFYKTELLFYAGRPKNIYIAKELYTLNHRDFIRRNWRACACASYMCSLVLRTSIPDAHIPEIFILLDRALDEMETAKNLDSALFHFELKYSNLLGIAPHLDYCIECKKVLNGETALFSPGRGACACDTCGHTGYYDAKPVSPEALAMMRFWLISGPRGASETVCPANQSQTIKEALGRFLEFHLDFNPVSRNIAFECLKMNE